MSGRALLGWRWQGLRLTDWIETDMYFWGTIVVLFILACSVGWKMDRKRKAGCARGNAGDALDGRANEALKRNRHDNGHG